MKIIDILKYKMLQIEHFIRMNTGKDKYGYQCFCLHIIPMTGVKSEVLLRQYYKTHSVWKVGSIYLLLT